MVQRKTCSIAHFVCAAVMRLTKLPLRVYVAPRYYLEYVFETCSHVLFLLWISSHIRNCVQLGLFFEAASIYVSSSSSSFFLNEKSLSFAKEGDCPWVHEGTGDVQNFSESPLRTDAIELSLNSAAE